MAAMSTEPEYRCPICLDRWEEVSYVMPCLHQFCYSCILQWAETKPECPLCKGSVTSILHSNTFEEHVITPSAAQSVVLGPAPGAAGPQDTHNLHRPASSYLSAVGLFPSAPVGGIYPHDWAYLFRSHRDLFWPLRSWLQRELRMIFEDAREEAAEAYRLILSCLYVFGPDEESLFQVLRDTLGRHTMSFVHRLIDITVEQGRGDTQPRMGWENTHASGERESSPVASPQGMFHSPSPALHGGPSSPRSVPVPTQGEEEEPQEDAEEDAPGPSTRNWGTQHSPGGPLGSPEEEDQQR